jgi:hypothetical protein
MHKRLCKCVSGLFSFRLPLFFALDSNHSLLRSFDPMNRLTVRLGCSLLFFVLASARLFAQPGGAYEQSAYFEGQIQYKIQTSGRIGEALSYYNPLDNMIMNFRGGDFIVRLTGNLNTLPQEHDEYGMPIGEFRFEAFNTVRLYIGDSDRVYIVDMANERAFTQERRWKAKSSTPPTAVPIQDSAIIAGVKCFAYRVVKPDEEIIYYINPKYRINTALYKGKKRAKAAFLTIGLDGCIPLKTIRKQKDIITATIATKITPSKYPVGLFRLPPGIKLVGADYRR